MGTESEKNWRTTHACKKSYYNVLFCRSKLQNVWQDLYFLSPQILNYSFLPQ